MGNGYFSKYRKTAPNKKTHEQFLIDVENKFGRNHKYIFLTEYIGMDYDIEIKCAKCGNIWKTRADRFISPRNKNSEPCGVCNKKLNDQKRGTEKINKTISNKKTVKQVNTQININELISGLYGNEYLLLSKYIDNKSPIKIKHKCGYEYSVLPIDIENGTNYTCPLCETIEKATEFIRNVYELEGNNYAVICEFNAHEVNFKVKHNKCGTEFSTTEEDFIEKEKRCINPRCSNRTNKYNFKDKVYEKYGDEYLVLEEYIDCTTEIEFKHNVEWCGKTFKRKPRYFLSGKSLCIFCQRAHSRGEKSIYDFLKNNKINFETQFSFVDCKDKSLLRFDFAIFDKGNNLMYILEFDGRHHFDPVDFGKKGIQWAKDNFIETQKHDQIKNNYCKENNIILFRIPYWYLDRGNIELLLDKIINYENINIDENFIVSS